MYDAIFKIVIFGEAGTGKVELTQRFLTDLYVTDSKMTIGMDFETKNLIIDDLRVRLQIWDFGGEERFRFLLPTYVRGARGGIFVYDITNYSTLAHIDDWLTVIKNEIRAEDIFPIVVVGNRAHLADQREVPAEDAIKIAKSRGLDGFIECSAKTGENVEEAFKALVRLILNCPQTREPRIRPAITDTSRYDVRHPSRLVQSKPKELGATVPAIPISLRGAIMSELKQIINRRGLQKHQKKPRDMKERREEIENRMIKRLKEATRLRDKIFMEQNLEEWLETLMGLKKGCEEIIHFLKDRNQEYYYHISFEQWKNFLGIISELLEKFKENSSSFYKMSDDTERKLYHLFEIFIPCREILSDGSFGKNVRLTFEEYLNIFKLKK